MMVSQTIKFILMLLFVFTPIAFGSVELWAFSLMELGILLLVVLWSVQNLVLSSPAYRSGRELGVRSFSYEILMICLFLIVVIFQLIPLPAGVTKALSPKTFEVRQALSFSHPLFTINDSRFTMSFVPFLTKVELYKWLTLSVLFLFLLQWNDLKERAGTLNQLLTVIFLVGVFESLYGMFEFFSGHHHILHLKGISSVTGTFVNRNYFAGYLLMVIPLSMGLLFSRQALQGRLMEDWRQRLTRFDGKGLLVSFGIILMILGLIFSASRMGILSLLLSFTLISLLFKTRQTKRGFSRSTLLILGLALLWGIWIGLDAVVSPFFNVSEDLKWRWSLWGDTFRIVKDFPALGTGLGTFSQIFPMYKSFHMRRLVTHAENDFLQLASEVGLVGIAILLVLFLFLFAKAVRRIRSLSTSDSERYIGIGSLVGILALMFHSLVERNLQVPANAFLFTFLWALALRTPSLKGSEEAVAGEAR